MSEEMKDLATTTTNMPAEYNPSAAYGFEETDSKDIVIPRIKVINALSPERVDGEAQEGDILNSLTHEDVKGKRFIPVKQYYSNIHWNPDRDAEPRMFCRSFDGKVGQNEDGVCICSQCGKNQFDNSKTGRAAQPQCTSYLNFLGFFEDSPMPVVLSFARTNYNEGRKMLSIAKSMRSAIWDYAYTIESRLVAKDRNKWYIMVPSMAGPTTPEQRKLAFDLYSTIHVNEIKADYEDAGGYADAAQTDAQVAEEI